MLTDLSFLNEGAQWPPDSEAERLEMYEANRKLFESKHAEIYEKQLRRIERVIGNFSDVINYPVILNFQRLMSLKVADLLLGEPPRIVAGEKDSDEQKAYDVIAAASDLINTLYMTAIDISRYGDGLLHIRKRGERGVISITQPAIWFPVVNPMDVHETVYHVLAWPVTIDGRPFLKAFIHSKGSYEERLYRMANSKIDGLAAAVTTVKTGLDDFAIVQIPNVITSDRATGLDDYTDIDSIISELMVRIGQIDRILDKHASPSVTGPQSSLEQDPVSGEWRLKMGNYFPRDTVDDPEVKYLTWNGNLESNFKAIEKLVNYLYTISEMGSVLFGDISSVKGDAPSGTALRRLMYSPLAKVNRIRMRFDPAIKKAIKLCSQLGGVNLSKVALSIVWQDGLPGDPREEAEIMNLRTASKATMSQKRAIMQYDGMTEADAETELAQIQDEEAAATPVLPGPFSQGQPSEPPQK